MPWSWAMAASRSRSGHVVLRVADRLDVHGLGLVVDGGGDGVGVVAVDEADVDAEAGKRHLELVVGAAVQVAGGDDVVAGLGERGDGEELRRLTRRRRHRRHAALEGGHPLLEHVGRRVHDAGVDVAELLQPEQPGGVVGVVEGVRGRLVDGDGPGLGARVRLLPRMELEGLEPVRVAHGRSGLPDRPGAAGTKKTAVIRNG
jgi:hypothetical protein